VGHHRLFGERLGRLLLKLCIVAVTSGVKEVVIYVTTKIVKEIVKKLSERFSITKRAADWATTVVNKIVPDPILRTASL